MVKEGKRIVKKEAHVVHELQNIISQNIDTMG